MRGNQHWLEEEEKKCRICKEKMENMIHVVKECEATREETMIKEILKEDGTYQLLS